MANPVTWFEIIGKDSTTLHKFYRDVFRWKLTTPVKEMGNYSMLEGHEPGIGGGLGETGTDEGSARVSIYIEVDDPQRYLDKAVANGARVVMPVMTVTPTTTIALFTDPAGNITGLLKANPRSPAAASAGQTARTSRPRAKAASARTGARAKKTATRGRKTATKRTATRRTKRR